MKKESYQEALRKVNDKRKQEGQEPLPFLPRGMPGNNTECPMARAGVKPTGDFVTEFDAEAPTGVEIDPWVLIENGDPEQGDEDGN